MKKKKSEDSLAIGVGVGVAIGTSLGVALDNLAIGIALGIALGAGLGSTGVFGGSECSSCVKSQDANSDLDN